MLIAIYYAIVLTCFVASLYVYKYHKSLRIFPFIIGTSIVIEICATILAEGFKINPFVVYHLYLPIDYTLMSYFFYQLIESKLVKKIVLYSAGFYIVISLSLSLFFYSFNDFPGLMLNLSGLFLVLISAHLLLTLEPLQNIPIYKHPIAWICIGIIVFYTGTFLLNGLYNYLVVTKSKNRAIIHAIVNNGLNYFMYSCFTVGLFCSHKLKNHLQPTA